MPDVKIAQFDGWLKDKGPVALVIRQYLLPAAQPDDVIFPPSYANPSQKEGDPSVYNIDGEGATSICVIDSIPSQANRLEPMFASDEYSKLVPQLNIKFKDGLTRNLLEIGHRIADAALRGTPLWPEVKAALGEFRNNKATALARLAPTSLVFGAWDSRDSQVKIPRLINSIIRARNVVQLRRSAQYIPAINYEREGLLPADLDKKPADIGLADVPSVHMIGGIQVNGDIVRDASLNLVSLRHLRGADTDETLKLQRYILGLCLVAMAAEPDLNLRQGCLLTLNPGKPPSSQTVSRDGTRTDTTLGPKETAEFAKLAAEDFGVASRATDTIDFDPKILKKWLDADKEAKAERKEKRAKGKAAPEVGQGVDTGGEVPA